MKVEGLIAFYPITRANYGSRHVNRVEEVILNRTRKILHELIIYKIYPCCKPRNRYLSVNILCFLLYHISQYIFTQNRNSLLPDPGIGINTISSGL